MKALSLWIPTPWGFLPDPAIAVAEFDAQWALHDSGKLPLFGYLPRRVLEKLRLSLDWCCWEYQGYLLDGYSRIYDEILGGMTLGHRYAWSRLVGPLPADATLDHRCRNLRCIWPGHMKPKTLQGNNRAKVLDRRHMIQPPLHHTFFDDYEPGMDLLAA